MSESLPATIVKPKDKREEKVKRQPPYNVILHNDDDHTYDYVIAMLQKLFGYPVEKGFLMAKEVDTSGRVIVQTTTMEHAELKRDQIHALRYSEARGRTTTPFGVPQGVPPNVTSSRLPSSPRCARFDRRLPMPAVCPAS